MAEEFEDKENPVIPPEDNEQTTPEDENPEEDTSINDGENQNDGEVKDWEAEAHKWKSTAENYKQEIEIKGLRKKELEKPVKDNIALKTDYLSKRADVLDELNSEFKELSEPNFNKLQTLLNPALESVYALALKENRFVARGELKRTIQGLLNFAKSEKERQAELEKARLEGIAERDKMSDAEIKGKSKSKAVDGYSDEVRQLAKEKEWTLEEAKIILEKRKQRERDYAPRNVF